MNAGFKDAGALSHRSAEFDVDQYTQSEVLWDEGESEEAPINHA